MKSLNRLLANLVCTVLLFVLIMPIATLASALNHLAKLIMWLAIRMLRFTYWLRDDPWPPRSSIYQQGD